MLTATVIGSVWATRRLAGLPNGAFLEVEAEGSGQRLIAFDVLGSGVGERVLPGERRIAAGTRGRTQVGGELRLQVPQQKVDPQLRRVAVSHR